MPTDIAASARPPSCTTSQSVRLCAIPFRFGLFWAFSCARLPNRVPLTSDRTERATIGMKSEEYRVAVTPNGAKEFVRAGHTVIVEKGAGVGSGFGDAAYKAAGASLAKVEDVFAQADMIVKVK